MILRKKTSIYFLAAILILNSLSVSSPLQAAGKETAIAPIVAVINPDWNSEAEKLYEAASAGLPLPAMETLPAEARQLPNAYRIQKIFFEKLTEKGDAVAGFKGALTAQAQMERFAADRPASAPLLTSGLTLIEDPAVPVELQAFPGMMLEVELTYKTKAKITAPVKDEAELKELIESVHPSIEVPQLYFQDMSKVAVFDIIAAGVGSKKFLVGPAAELSDPDAVSIKLEKDGEVINEGPATDALGGQWKALLWIVNNIVENGYVIEEGQYIMTGALGKMLPAQPGEYKADFGFTALQFKISQ